MYFTLQRSKGSKANTPIKYPIKYFTFKNTALMCARMSHCPSRSISAEHGLAATATRGGEHHSSTMCSAEVRAAHLQGW